MYAGLRYVNSPYRWKVGGIEHAKEIVRDFYPDGDPFAAGRKLKNVVARRALIWLLTTKLQMPVCAVARYLGKHHTSIIHARDSFELGYSLVPADNRLKKLFDQ